MRVFIVKKSASIQPRMSPETIVARFRALSWNRSWLSSKINGFVKAAEQVLRLDCWAMAGGVPMQKLPEVIPSWAVPSQLIVEQPYYQLRHLNGPVFRTDFKTCVWNIMQEMLCHPEWLNLGNIPMQILLRSALFFYSEFHIPDRLTSIRWYMVYSVHGV